MIVPENTLNIKNDNTKKFTKKKWKPNRKSNTILSEVTKQSIFFSTIASFDKG